MTESCWTLDATSFLLSTRPKWLTALVLTIYFLRLTSDQVGIPAELKHINKRRKRNQQGLP